VCALFRIFVKFSQDILQFTEMLGIIFVEKPDQSSYNEIRRVLDLFSVAQKVCLWTCL